ncbi:MAG: tRNA pseudouridine(38-40) synthase TruA [Planctomycetota bacterium]
MTATVMVAGADRVPRYKLTIAYDGTDYCGWQKQEPPDPDNPGQRTTLPTVQGVVEEAVREVLREPGLVLAGASRTDSGVHALGQVAAFTSEPDGASGVGWPAARGTERLVKALNAKLPRDVLVREAEVVDDAFEPIGGALEKEYTYTIVSGETRPLWDRRYVWHTWYELDIERMRAAAAHLVGEHDFAAFAQINHGRKSTVRTIFRCDIEIGLSDGKERRFVVRVAGNGFLYNMVRIVAGTLMEVGRGKIEPGDIPAILASKDRRQAGATLPPTGLRLEWVRYEDAQDQ